MPILQWEYSAGAWEESTSPPHLRQALLHGHGAFETLLLLDGVAPLLPWHWARLAPTLQEIRVGNPWKDLNQLSTTLADLVDKAGNPALSRVRVQVSAGPEGQSSDAPWTPLVLAEVQPLEQDPWQNDFPLVLGLAPEPTLGFSSLSCRKTTMRIPYVVAAELALREHWGDCLLRGPLGWAESSRSNLWWIKEGVLHTPPLPSGCIQGVMRSWLAQCLPQWGHHLQETACTDDDLHAAECVFLTNALRGIQPVADRGPVRGNPSHPLLLALREQALHHRNHLLLP